MTQHGTTGAGEAGEPRNHGQQAPLNPRPRCVPGMVPMVTSGWPNLAVSPATMMSHIMASSHPPPRA